MLSGVIVLSGLPVGAAPGTPQTSAFVHPGLLHTHEDVARMQAAVAARQEPVWQGFQALAVDRFSQANYSPRGPFPEWGRGSDGHKTETEHDANAAYQNALMWAITGNPDHAKTAIQLLDAWSSTLTNIQSGDVLASGLQGFKFANAAELLRYTGSGWPPDHAERCEQWFLKVWYPVVQDYAHYANANWEGAALRTIMAIAVYCDDRELFESAVRYAVHGAGNGSITHTIVYPSGQAQESGRDQPHTQLGLGCLALAAEVAWNQGVDLYGWADNRILAGFEYTAEYNLGEEVPYQPYLDRTGKYGAGGSLVKYTRISPQHRGRFMPIYEMVWNHYGNRRGLAAPYTRRAAEQIRPECSNRDLPGFGTLTFSRPSLSGQAPKAAPGSPAGLVAHSLPSGIRLTWARSVEAQSASNAKSYSVKRSASPSAAFRLIASGIADTSYLDSSATPGTLYYYRVSAMNQAGESPDSVPLAACAGLPRPWQQLDVGDVPIPGYTEFNGHTYILEAAGDRIGANRDQFHFAAVTLRGNGCISARIREVSSQRAQVGVMMRDTKHPNSRQASILLSPGSGGGFLVRAADGATVSLSGNVRLEAARWVRLVRHGNTFSGLISADGQHWQLIGSTEIPMGNTILVGLAACSGLKGVTTTAAYDNVDIN